MAEEQSILEVRNITKRFPGVVALDDVSVEFYPGEVHAIVGENGAGKSTLMKVLVGAYLPDEGEIVFQGKKVSFSHPRKHKRTASVSFTRNSTCCRIAQWPKTSSLGANRQNLA